MRKHTESINALYQQKYKRLSRNERVKNSQWILNGLPIARCFDNGEIQINWQIGFFSKNQILSRMRALSMFFGMPLPLIEEGWITIKIGNPVYPVKWGDGLRLARHIFYSETGANVEEAVFAEVLLSIESGGKKEEWLRDNPKQGIIWDICEKIKIIKE